MLLEPTSARAQADPPCPCQLWRHRRKGSPLWRIGRIGLLATWHPLPCPDTDICMYSVTVAIWSKLLTRSAGSKLSTPKGAGRCLPLKGASSASASVPRGGLYSPRPDNLAAFWIDKMNLSVGYAGYCLEERISPFGRIVVNFVPDLRIHSS